MSVVRAAAGDFEGEAIPWMDAVYRFAMSLCRDPDRASDILQDTYLRAQQSWHTYTPGSDCRKWLFTICRNVYLRTLERDARQVDVSVEDLDSFAAVTDLARATNQGEDNILSRVALRPVLAAAFASVPPLFREAVVLVDLEEMSYAEASVVLGVPVGTVRSRLFRGRRQLQELLLEHARDFGVVKGNRHGGASDE